MFIHNINPILIKLGPFQIRWYGVIFVLGFIAAYFFINYLAKRKKLGLEKEDVADFLTYLIIGVIIGSRVFYIVFYNLKFYLSNPLHVFALWEGGLSFHGGLTGAFIISLYFCKNKKIDFYKLADIVVIPLAFGLIFGRIANFINGELVGRITNMPWCFKFQGYEGCRHPSQLYESLKNVVIFTTLWNIKDKKYPDGTLFWLFVVMYGTLRFFIEFVRAPDQQLGFIIFNLTMGQLLNIVMALVGGVMLFRLFKKKP